MPATHAPHPDEGLAALGGTLCGRFGALGAAVTCKLCAKRLAGDVLPEEALLAAIIGVEYAPRIGARRLEDVSRRALAEAQRAHDEPKRRVSNPDREAAAYFRARIEGASLRSTTDPDRANRVQVSTTRPKGGREHAAIERHATAARALMRASWREEDIAAVWPLPPAIGLQAYMFIVAGKPVQATTGSGGTYLKWVSRNAEMIAVEDLGRQVSTDQVLDVSSYFREEVRAALIASGEMRPRAARRGHRGLDRIDWSKV